MEPTIALHRQTGSDRPTFEGGQAALVHTSQDETTPPGPASGSAGAVLPLLDSCLVAGVHDVVEPLPGSVGSVHDAELSARTWAELASLLAGSKTVRISPDGGLGFPAGRRHERELSAQQPGEPAAVSVGDAKALTGRLLVGDFDVSKAEARGVVDPRGQVAVDAAALVVLVERAGGRCVHDVSPSGGRHVYLKFDQAVPFDRLARLARALVRRFPRTFDAAPMAGPAGQIRIPGSPHKRTVATPGPRGADRLIGPLSGFMTLTMPLRRARSVLRRPCGVRVLERLEALLAAELDDLAPVLSLDYGLPPRDERGVPYLPLAGGRRALPEALRELATTGRWQERYPTRSEARYALVGAAVAAGWTLGQLEAELAAGGSWTGAARRLIGSAPRRRALVAREWRKQVEARHRARQHGRNSDTSLSSYTPAGAPTLHDSSGPATAQTWSVLAVLSAVPAPARSVWEELHWWAGAVWCAERDPVRRKGWGRASTSIRLVLRALALAARLRGELEIDFGTRSLALMCGLSHQSVAAALQQLREEHDPLIDLITTAEGERADLYRLRIPHGYRLVARRRPWRAGRIEAGHPVFLELGPTAALMYEALSDAETRSVDLQEVAVLSHTATTQALAVLHDHGLATRGKTGWRRGPVDLDTAARHLDAFTRWHQRLETYREDRRQWHEFLENFDPLTRAAKAVTQAAEQIAAEAAEGGQAGPDTSASGAAGQNIVVPGARRPTHDELPEDGWKPRPEITVLPPEVAAIIAAERAAIVEDELLLEAERTDYEACLAEMRQARSSVLHFR